MEEKSRVMSNFIWRFMERSGAQGISFVVSIILARVLKPELYGTIALITVFTSIMQVFIQGGTGSSLIQKKDADELDFSTIFYFNMLMCLTLYIFMYVLAPYIAKFYNDLSLTPVIRVLSLSLIISGIKNIQQAYITKNMLFKYFFFATLGGTIFAAALGIWMAYHGYGIWALVAQELSNAIIDTVVLWITGKWRPKLRFSFKRLRGLYSYGWKMLVSGLLDTLYNDLRQLIIGKIYSPVDLAYYNKGSQFPKLVVNNVNTSIDSVLLPVMSNMQDDKMAVKRMLRQSIKVSTYVMAPCMMGIAFLAEPIVRLLLTEKWMDCVVFVRIFCVTYMFYPIHTANLNAIKAMGRSDLFLKLEIVKKMVGIVVLVTTMWFGVTVMAYSLLLTTLLSMLINSWPNKKILNYSLIEQIKDILPGILLAFFMGICIYYMKFFSIHYIILLILQILCGICIYILGSIILKLEAFSYIISIVKSFGKRK